MAIKQNCWEFKNCGREPGGLKAAELGACAAALAVVNTGVNEGKAGGRICWAVTGTLCGGEVQGTFAQKRLACITCDFFRKVKEEEEDRFILLREAQRVEDVLRESEERYRAMFDRVPVGLYRTTPVRGDGSRISNQPALFPDAGRGHLG